MFCLLSHTSETQVRTARGQSPGIVLILLLPAKTTPQHQDPRAKLAGALPELHGAPKGPLLPPPVAPTPRTTAEKHLYGKQGLSTSGTKPSRLQITPRIKPTALTVASKALGHRPWGCLSNFISHNCFQQAHGNQDMGLMAKAIPTSRPAHPQVLLPGSFRSLQRSPAQRLSLQPNLIYSLPSNLNPNTTPVSTFNPVSS